MVAVATAKHTSSPRGWMFFFSVVIRATVSAATSCLRQNFQRLFSATSSRGERKGQTSGFGFEQVCRRSKSRKTSSSSAQRAKFRITRFFSCLWIQVTCSRRPTFRAIFLPVTCKVPAKKMRRIRGGMRKSVRGESQSAGSSKQELRSRLSLLPVGNQLGGDGFERV